MQYFHAPSTIGIIDAVQRGDLECVQRIINLNQNCLDLVDDKGYSCFHWAVYIDDVRILDLLIRKHPMKIWDMYTQKKQSVLHIACSNSSLNSIRAIVAHLKQHGPKHDYINESNLYKETSLHVAAGTNRADIVQLLLSAGADPYLQDKWGRTARKVSLENGYIVTAAAIALSYSEDYNLKDDEPENSKSPLVAATLNFTPKLTSTQAMLAAELRTKLNFHSASAGADDCDALLGCADTGTGTGLSKFGLACTVTDEKHIFKDITERTPKQIATSVAPHPPKVVLTALSKLVEFPGDPVHLAELLNDESIALNGKDMYGLTALMKFAAWNKVELLQILLPRLSAEDIAVTGGKQKLPLLHYCVDMDAWHALRCLLKDNRVAASQVDEFQRTFMEHAKYVRKIDVLLQEVPESVDKV